MRSHAPDDSVANSSASNPLDEFAAEGSGCQAQPEPALSIDGSLLQVAPPEKPRESIQEPFSRIEAREIREMMRRNRRKSPGSRFAAPAAAVRRSMTEACTTVRHGAQRASTAVRQGQRAGRRLSLRIQRRAAALRARMVGERETIKTHAHHGVVALAQALSSVTHRSKEAAINLALQSAGVMRDGRRASNRLEFELRRQAAASKEQMKLARDAVQRSALLAWCRCVAAAKSATVRSERVWTAWTDRWTAGSSALPRPLTESALEHQEFNGFVVAVVLAATVIGYGGLLLVFSRTPTDAPVKRVAAPVQARGAQAMTALAAPVMGDGSVVHASPASRPAVVPAIATDVAPPAAFTPSARTLTALWQSRDTRSLDRAFSTLRSETLAFRSCGMRMTDADRAVARCQGVATTLGADGTPSSRSAIWTINFRRSGGRWLIARVAAR